MNTPYIIWSKKNATGITLIDDQHRSIITMLNTLFYFVRLKVDKEVLLPLMAIIEQYMTAHFSVEEILLRQSRFEDVEAHAEDHGDILGTLRTLLLKIRESGEPEELFEFLRSWWKGHAEAHDQKYKPHITAYLRAGQAAEPAAENGNPSFLPLLPAFQA